MTNPLCTDRKVCRPLADLLPSTNPTKCDIVRWSLTGGSDTGVSAQRSSHFAMYADDPDIAVLASLSDAVWDPKQPEIGLEHGVRWIRLEDIHHSARGREPVAAVIAVGETVFMQITMSSTIKHIDREDGEAENGATRLLQSLLNSYPRLRKMRWVDDAQRANRDHVDWSQIIAKCKARDVVMVFGGREYDQRDDGAVLALQVLGMVASEGDPARRLKLTGKRLGHYIDGGAAISEPQMPYG